MSRIACRHGGDLNCRSANGRAALPRRPLFAFSFPLMFNYHSGRCPTLHFLNPVAARQPKGPYYAGPPELGFPYRLH